MYTLPGAVLALAVGAVATPLLGDRADCPPIHVFGARGTTEQPGYGAAAPVVNNVLKAHPSATAEAIVYPACGGGSACGGYSYSQSVERGTNAVISQVGAFAKRCPNTQIVVAGYSQGGEIFDNALCGGGDPNQGIPSFSGSIAQYNIKAAIFMGDPRFQAGAPYNVGTCKEHGFDGRPPGQYCGSKNSVIQTYCDAGDPYCCRGNDPNTHGSYNNVYGAAALKFINSKLT